MRRCGVDGCDRKHYAKGYCQPHYIRVLAHGHPQADKPLKCQRGKKLAWIKEHINHAGDDCLLWPWPFNGSLRPYANYEGQRIVASRLMCIFRWGPPPTPQHEAAHSCGNGDKGCMNPNHLRWATARENCLDRFKHDSMPCAKLTEPKVKAIRKIGRRKTATALSKRFGVSVSAICAVLNRKSWKHI
jgi:hypothetical protein